VFFVRTAGFFYVAVGGYFCQLTAYLHAPHSIIKLIRQTGSRYFFSTMSVPRPRPLRSTTLLSGSSSLSHRLHSELSLRKSLVGHWTLIDPQTHKTVYYVSPPTTDSTREIRRNSPDGHLVAQITLKTTPSECLVFLPDENTTLRLKRTLRGRYRFAIKGKSLYWKRDAVCRESFTRRMFADTDSDTLLIYESGESILDALVASYIAMKCKREYSRFRKFFGLKIVPGVDWLLVQMMRFCAACHQ